MKVIKCIVALTLVLCISLLCACGSTQRPDVGNTDFSKTTSYTTTRFATTGTTSCRHVIVPDRAVAATCTEDGLTEGAHCSACGAIVVPQQVVSAPGHLYGEWSDPRRDWQKQWVCSRFCKGCGKEDSKLLGIAANSNDLGSAGELSGTTLLVAVFADDAYTNWDFTTVRDRDTKNLMRRHLSVAAKWLEQQCQAYGVTSRFVYDWESNPDLYYTYDFGRTNLVRPDSGEYWKQAFYVEDHIPSEQLKQKYNAQNILYLFYLNTDEQNTVNSWCLADAQGMKTEIVNIFVRDDLPTGYYYMSASGLAHEILHSFGAHDLYYASEVIPQAYVDLCTKTGSNDIMYTISQGGGITQVLSLLDAYYVGLVDDCELVDRWGLGKSTHGK